MERFNCINLPNDDQVANWFAENIDDQCSASSAIYKFRLWLKSTINGDTSFSVEDMKEAYKAGLNHKAETLSIGISGETFTKFMKEKYNLET